MSSVRSRPALLTRTRAFLCTASEDTILTIDFTDVGCFANLALITRTAKYELRWLVGYAHLCCEGGSVIEVWGVVVVDGRFHCL